MLNGRAIGLSVVAIVLFLLAGATNVGWVRVVDAVLFGMLLLSLLLEWLSVTAVDASRRLVGVERSTGDVGPMEDDTIEVEVELRNRRFWPRFFTSISYEAPLAPPTERWQRFFLANLSGHSTVGLTSRIECYRRGVHHLLPVTIESQVPFGLFRRRRVQEAPLSVLVYPHVYPMKQLALTQVATGVAQQSRRSRTGQEVIGSREYTPGDPMRLVHWRNTARLGRLAVKEVEDTSERALSIVFDTRESIGEERESTLEYAVKLAASIGVYAMKSGEAVQLLAGMVQGEWSVQEPFLRTLATIEPSDSPSLENLLQMVPPSTPAVAFVAAQDEEGLRAIQNQTGRLSSLSVVVLEGFGGQGPNEVALRLQGTGIDAVACRRGEIEEAITALETGQGTGAADVVSLVEGLQ